MSPPEPLQPVSGLVPAEHRERLIEIGGQAGVSAGLRFVVAAGLATLEGQSPELSKVVDHLDQLADQLARVTGRKTPSNAWWAPSEAAAPSPDLLDPCGAVIATPHGLVLLAADACLAVDLQAGLISALENGEELQAPLDVQQLVEPVAVLMPALIGLSSTGPGFCKLGHGLTLERTQDDRVKISLGGLGPVVPASIAWQWAAEMGSLLARSLDRSVQLRTALARQLEAVG